MLLIFVILILMVKTIPLSTVDYAVTIIIVIVRIKGQSINERKVIGQIF